MKFQKMYIHLSVHDKVVALQLLFPEQITVPDTLGTLVLPEIAVCALATETACAIQEYTLDGAPGEQCIVRGTTNPSGKFLPCSMERWSGPQPDLPPTAPYY